MKSDDEVRKELDRLMRYQKTLNTDDRMFLVTWREIHKLRWVLGEGE